MEIQEVKGLMPTPVNTDGFGRSCSSASGGHPDSGQGRDSSAKKGEGKTQRRWGTPQFCTVTVATTYIPHMVSCGERAAIAARLRDVRYSRFSRGTCIGRPLVIAYSREHHKRQTTLLKLDIRNDISAMFESHGDAGLYLCKRVTPIFWSLSVGFRGEPTEVMTVPLVEKGDNLLYI